MRLDSAILSNVKIEDSFWNRHTNLVEKVIIPYQWEIMNDRIPDVESSHCLDNFRIAAGIKEGEFYGAVFQDTDIAKWLEAVGYSLATHKNEELEKLADDVIDLLIMAQQPDGYMDMYFILKEPSQKWKNLCEGHELYTAGHLIEAAIAYYTGTGKKRFLNAMVKLADLICDIFGKEYGKNHGYPGHQEIEIALVKLAKITGNDKYMEQAKHFLDMRGVGENYFLKERKRVDFQPLFPEFEDYDPAYSQSHLPVREQKTAEGHAVRAVYMYSAMADIAYEYQDTKMLEACKTLWENIVQKRMYVTGGIGSSGFLERFTTDYDLPNDCNYSETCASIGMAMFGLRMANITRESKYADVVELELYNGILSGIALDGKSFFYVNPLEVKPANCMPHTYRAHVKSTRQKWFGVACCPPNIARTLASLGQYIYGINNNEIYFHLYISNEMKYEFEGQTIELKTNSEMPWKGYVQISTKGICRKQKLYFRIPEYANKFCIKVNEKQVTYNVSKGYAEIEVKSDCNISISFDMPVNYLWANPKVSADIGKVAVKRGPIVYCMEQVDNGEDLADYYIDINKTPEITTNDELNKSLNLVFKGWKLCSNSEKLYDVCKPELKETTLKMIPYAYWNNRGEGEMLVWIHSVVKANE